MRFDRSIYVRELLDNETSLGTSATEGTEERICLASGGRAVRNCCGWMSCEKVGGEGQLGVELGLGCGGRKEGEKGGEGRKGRRVWADAQVGLDSRH